MNVSIVTIGDEILVGQIVDTNSAWIAKKLNEKGFQLREILSVGDSLVEIMDAIDRSFKKSEVVLVTGGLGPTKDDITVSALCKYFKCESVFHEETFERIKKMFERRNFTITDAHKEQCFLPEIAEILNNDLGTAPGMWIKHKGKVLVSMPGVPYEMYHLMSEHVLPKLAEYYTGPPIKHLTIRTAGAGESVLADMLKEIENNLPPNVKLAYLPDVGQVRLRFSISGLKENQMDEILEDLKSKTLSVLGDLVYATEDISLEEFIGTELKAKNLKLITCESCTGGFLAHKITSIAGSSAYFLGSIVSYSNDMKNKILGVSTQILESAGAVSQETAEAMVFGGLKAMGADLAVSITGVAGPGGGSVEKPVGTVWIAVGNNKKVVSHKYLFTKDRQRNIQYSAAYALIMLRNFLLKN
jgi:nicotinamide-nucleotide amidase